MHRQRYYSFGYIMIVGLLIAGILPLLIISIYSRPCVDDFSYSINTHALVESGKWNIMQLLGTAYDTDLHFYNTWQGLYTSAFILSLQPGIFGHRWYFTGSICLLILAFVATYYFLSAFKENFRIERKHIVICALGIVVILFNRVPSIVQGLYWFNGAWNYMPFFFLGLVNVALVIRAYSAAYSAHRYKYIAYSTLLSFVISGGNHVTSFLNIMVLSLLLIGICLNRKKPMVLIPLISAVTGFYIMYRAPGTSNRQSLFERQGVIETILECTKKSIKLMEKWFDIPLLLVILLAVLWMTSKLVERKTNNYTK